MTADRRVTCLIVTRQCNLRCGYCYVDDKQEAHMSLETAKQAVTEAFYTDTDAFGFLEIDMIGGEPLCVFPMLRALHDWARSRTWPKPYVFYATTNGTLLDAPMKQWFRENRETFWLGLSYDGGQEAQDANRSQSFDLVDVDFFRETWPEQTFKMTIDERNIPTLARDVISLHESGTAFRASIACGMPRWATDAYAEYARQLMLLVRYYLDHPEVKMFSLLGEINLHALREKQGETPGRACEAGTKLYYAVDMDGRRYPCHMLSPLALHEDRMAGRDMFTVLESGTLDSRCEGCVLNAVCPLCYGMSYRVMSDPFRREENICVTYRLQLLALCKYHAACLCGKSRKTAEDFHLSQTILAIHRAMGKRKGFLAKSYSGTMLSDSRRDH